MCGIFPRIKRVRGAAMSKSLNGVCVPHKKKTAEMAAIRMPAPKLVTLPTSMHIGKPAIPIVKPGDTVKVGQLIAEQNGFISSPVYSSVSGTVKKTEDILLSGGAYVPAIIIESDGLMTVAEGIAPPNVSSREEFIAAVKTSGIVGLGGAGFPTYVKLDVKAPAKIEEVIINGAECEPYITSDTRTMIDNDDLIAEGIKLFEKYLGVGKFVIGIEKNKPEAIKHMKALAEKNPAVTVKTLKSIYPQGGEKVLIYNTVGKVVPAGKLPIDVGCVVVNCTTMAAIAKYIKTGMPLVEKCVTVDGNAVKAPQNVIVPIGTSLADVFEFCGGFSVSPEKIICGGPMMGLAVPYTSVPIMKNTNGILALAGKDAKEPKTTQCIHCGRCVIHCPLGLSSTAIGRAYENGNGAELEKLHVNICMECGCCAYICPAKRPLIQTNKLAKAMLRDYQTKRAAREKEESGK